VGRDGAVDRGDCRHRDRVRHHGVQREEKINIGDLILETLECLELNGGPEAFINIQYMVPAYQAARTPQDEE
jgi:hypothetical protein